MQAPVGELEWRRYVVRRIIQLESQPDGTSAQRTCREPRAQLIEQTCQQKSQRLKFFNGIFECHLFFKTKFWFGQNHGTQRSEERRVGKECRSMWWYKK